MNKNIFIIMILGMFIFFTSFTSAIFDVKTEVPELKDNYTISNDASEYPAIAINTWFDIDWFSNTKAEIILTDHNKTCQDCISKIAINTYQDSALIDDLLFYKVVNGTNSKEASDSYMQDYNLYYYGKINETKTSCTQNVDNLYKYGNDTSCEDVVIGSHNGWIRFTEGQKFPAGNYFVKVTGTKDPSISVDFVIVTQGKIVNELAVWGNITNGDDGEIILRSPANNTSTAVNTVQFNISAAQVYSSKSPREISFCSDISGSWGCSDTKLNNVTYKGGLETGLVAYYSFDDSINTTNAFDDSFMGQLANNSGVTINQTGKRGQAYLFDSSDNVKLLNSSLLNINPNTQDISISAWFKSTDTEGMIVAKDGNTGSSIQYRVFFASNGRVWADYGCGTTATSSSSYNDGAWHHVLFFANSTATYLYMDGSYAATGTRGTCLYPQQAMIGDRFAGSYPLSGTIDEVMIWNRSLNATDAAAIYAMTAYEWDAVTYRLFNKTLTSGSTLWGGKSCTITGICGYSTVNNTLLYSVDAPSIEIISNPTITNLSINHTIQYRVNQSNLANCTLEYNSTNRTIPCTDGMINSTNFTVSKAITTGKIYANDTDSNMNSTSFTLTFDSTAPVITLVSPANQTSTASGSVVNISFSVSDTNLDTCVWSNGTTNTSLACNTNISYTVRTGNNIVTLYANDSVGNYNSESVYLYGFASTNITDRNTNVSVVVINGTVNVSEGANVTFNNSGDNKLWYNWFINGVTYLSGFGQYIFNHVFNLNSTVQNATVTLYTSEKESYSFCYQESVSEPNLSGTDGSCGTQVYIGILHIINGSYDNFYSMFDGDFNTYSSSSNGWVEILYDYPINSTSNSLSALWKIKTEYELTNVSLSNYCFNSSSTPNDLMLFVYSFTNGTTYYTCSISEYYTVPNTITIGSNKMKIQYISNTSILYEEGIYWSNYPLLSDINEYNIITNSSNPSVIINYPTTLIDFGIIGNKLQVSFTATDDNLANCTLNYNGTNVSVPCSSGVPSLVNITLTSNKSAKLWVNDSVGNINYTEFSWDYKIFEDGSSYNLSTYETASNTFTLNLTSNTSIVAASLWYAGTEYTGATFVNTLGNNYTLSKTIDVPVGAANNTFYFNLTLSNGDYVSTVNRYQNVSTINFGLCNATLTQKYLNLSFQDESTLLPVNASIQASNFLYYLGTGSVNKTYLYSNATELANYSFCALPGNFSYKVVPTVSYTASGYVLRTYNPGMLTLSNTTLNRILYLLATTNAYQTTFVVSTLGYTPIQGATVTVSRIISGNNVVVGTSTTGSDGSATFYLNPSYVHTVTATKTGYPTTSVSITPSQGTYTILLGGSGISNVTYTNYLDGINYTFGPSPGILNQDGLVGFWYYPQSSVNNLVKYKLELVSTKDEILSYVEGTNPSGSNISLIFNISNYTKIFGKMYIDIGNGYFLIDPTPWMFLKYESGNSSIRSGFKSWVNSVNFNDPSESYSTLMLSFFLLFMACAILSYNTGAELDRPGMILIPLTFGVLIFSIAGIIQVPMVPTSDGNIVTNFVESIVNKLGVFFVVFFFSAGYYLNRVMSN